MQLPKRKPGKFTHLKVDQNITEEKLGELKDELQKLKKFILPLAAEEVATLAQMGDFSENAAYQMAKGRLRGVNQRILELKDQIKHAIIIKPIKNAQIVQIGHKVTIESNGKEKTYLILGSAETDPLKGIISQNSPLGSTLLGQKLGTTIEIPPKGVEWKIVRIE